MLRIGSVRGFVLGPMIWSIGASLTNASHLGLQILRILCMALDTFCFYYATRTMPPRRRHDFLHGCTADHHRNCRSRYSGKRVESFRWGRGRRSASSAS